VLLLKNANISCKITLAYAQSNLEDNIYGAESDRANFCTAPTALRFKLISMDRKGSSYDPLQMVLVVG
jgi:hypothetical protein